MPELRQHLLDAAKPGEWTLPAGSATDQAPAQLARQLVREKVFEYLNHELPYALRVEHVSWDERRDGTARCEQHVLVPSQRIRAMVVGKRGDVIRRIGIAARCELDKALGRTVHLVLKVRVAVAKEYSEE